MTVDYVCPHCRNTCSVVRWDHVTSMCFGCSERPCALVRTDEELVVRAAKAAGHTQSRREPDGRLAVFMYDRCWVLFDPLNNDGDLMQMCARIPHFSPLLKWDEAWRKFPHPADANARAAYVRRGMVEAAAELTT